MTLNKKKRLVITILAMEFTSLSMGAVSPALANIGQAFPNISQMYLSMLSTIPALICVPISIWASYIAGKKIPYRIMAIVGFTLLILSGLGPYFSNDFLVILVWRILFGVGMGIIAPLGSIIMFKTFTKEEVEIQVSSNTIFDNLGAVVFQLAGGFLCSSFGWRNTFLVYLLFIPCMMLVMFFMPKIEADKNTQKTEDGKSKGKSHYGRRFWGWCILYFFFCVLFYPIVTQSSAIIINNNYGTADGVSILLSIFTIGGIIGGLIYRLKKVRRMSTKIIFPVLSVCAIGFIFFIFATNLITLIAGALIFGIGYGTFVAAIIIFAGYSVTKDKRHGVIARLLVSSGLGGFLSSFIMYFIGQIVGNSSERFPFIVSTIAFVLLGVFFLVKTWGVSVSDELIDDNIENDF